MAYKIKTAAETYPVTLAEVKMHLHIAEDNTSEDDLISGLIATAVDFAENYTDKQFITATWELYLDDFSTEIKITKSPVISISEIAYVDSNGENQTFDTENINLDNVSEPVRLKAKNGFGWPDVYDDNNVVKITFTAGYGDATKVPGTIKTALLLIIAFLYENRGDEGHRTLPRSIYNLLDNYRNIYI